MILITGITGKIGVELLPQLAASNQKFRLLVRDPSKVKAPPNAELVKGDLADAASVAQAMTGVTKAFLVVASFPGSSKLHNDAIDAAKKAGVKHLVRLSVNGASATSPVTLARWHAESDAHLQASGIPYTLLQPGSFMQNFFSSAATIKKDGAIYGASGEGTVPFIDARDIASVALHVLTTPGHENKTYVLTGSQALSYGAVASKLGALLAKPVKYVSVPVEQFKASVVAAGVPGWLADDYVVMNQATAAGHMSTVSGDVAKLLGKARTVDEFLAANLAVFKG